MGKSWESLGIPIDSMVDPLRKMVSSLPGWVYSMEYGTHYNHYYYHDYNHEYNHSFPLSLLTINYGDIITIL